MDQDGITYGAHKKIRTKIASITAREIISTVSPKKPFNPAKNNPGFFVKYLPPS